MCTQPGAQVQPTIAIVTGDASRRNTARTPVFDKPVQKGITLEFYSPDSCPLREPILNEARLQQCAIQSSVVGVGGRDCSIMRTSPTQTRGQGVKTSFIDASLRTPVGTFVSTKPPASPPSLLHSPLNAKLDASHRSPATNTLAIPSGTCCSMEPSRGSSTVTMASPPTETHLGAKPAQVATSRSPISSSLETSLATCCGAEPTQDVSCRSRNCIIQADASQNPCDTYALTSWLIGVHGPLPSGEDLAEKLRAMAPNVYED